MSNGRRYRRRPPAPIVGRRGLPRPVPYDVEELSDLLAAQDGPTPVERRRLDEWQYAADLAELALTLDACRQFGLVTGGPTVNVDRCHRLIEQAARRGIEPDPPETLMADFVRELATPEPTP